MNQGKQFLVDLSLKTLQVIQDSHDNHVELKVFNALFSLKRPQVSLSKKKQQLIVGS